ncbi:hypothetical protein AL755_20120 [Arthrobacter sp. ERGS1:01]|uniref:hypothetical protein n=1 Tax=Arthrobacter sp. ERGS1:01 TaxID=1704044 RepID=UPI0006B59A55|nr:hypothetical protein [Arthrobacter sp. ERGS1:01]ALE07247.1 hypothetical protein AL755_20120 [Arthrobacter sp. ERGS1:01]
MNTMDKIRAALAGLSAVDTAAAVEQLRGMLAGLPEDGRSATDGLLRADLDLFLLGYDAGTRAATGRG